MIANQDTSLKVKLTQSLTVTHKACPTTFNSTKTDISLECGFLPLEYTSSILSLILSCALPSTLLSVTLSSQCSYSSLFPLQFSSHPFTENVHPPEHAHIHSHDCSIKISLKINSDAHAHTCLLCPVAHSCWQGC